jgi:phosphoglycolate phosphatase-like HAD superfamily hydrolase
MARSTTLVLFDIDGTLLRGAGLHHKQALIEGIRKVTGLTTHLDGVSTSGMLDGDLVAVMIKAAGGIDRHAGEAMRQILEECQNAYDANCPSDLTGFLCPGVRNVLVELRSRGAVLGVVTGNLSRIAHRKMELAGIAEYFSVGAFAEDAGTRAELARVAAERAIEKGFIAPISRTSLIGDHPNDIAAARANGFQAIAVATGLIRMEELKTAQPDILIQTLEELDIEKLF